MRRMSLLVPALVVVNTMLYSALVPLLPGLTREFDLTSLNQDASGGANSGIRGAALIGGPTDGAMAAHRGSRQASLAFGFAGGFWDLFMSRQSPQCTGQDNRPIMSVVSNAHGRPLPPSVWNIGQPISVRHCAASSVERASTG
jgi:hypothetical protein